MGARSLTAGYVDDVTKDQCSEVGAKRLADAIVQHWQRRGYHGIQAKAVLAPVPAKLLGVYCAPVYSIATNIGPRGYPPQQPL